MDDRNATRLWFAAVAVAVAVLGGVCWWRLQTRSVLQTRSSASVVDAEFTTRSSKAGKAKPAAASQEVCFSGKGASQTGGDIAGRPGSGPQRAAAEESADAVDEDRLVDAFDNLTDKWIKPAAGGVTMKDVENFVNQFRKLPGKRRDECLHRALNLVPDANVMLLAGILMDKTMDAMTVKTVFNDVLNRDEDVKEPILRQIYQDRTHVCWADTAWILDVTGKIPTKK